MTSNVNARTIRQLQMMAAKLQNNQSYMAWVLFTYQKQERISINKLVEAFNTNDEFLAKLALCKKPNTQSKSFREQINQISQYTGIDTFLLVKIIRQVESVEQLSSIPNDEIQQTSKAIQFGFAAARDKEESSNENGRASEKGNDDVAEE